MSQSFFGQPLVVRPAAGPIRIGDAERDQAVSLLGDHFAAGRLNREELDERIDQAIQAKFSTDLQPLFADLQHLFRCLCFNDQQRLDGPDQCEIRKNFGSVGECDDALIVTQ